MTLIPPAMDAYDRHNEQVAREVLSERLEALERFVATMATKSGSLALPTENLTTLANGANANVVLPHSTVVRITGPSAVFSISGFTRGYPGRLLILHNASSYTLTLTHDATSTAANRITTPTGVDTAVPSGNSVMFYYSTATSRWIVSSPPSSASALTGAGATARVAFWDSATTLGSDADFTWTAATNTMGLASGTVVNWNSGDVTLTHSANALAFAGGTVSFDAVPTVNSAPVITGGTHTIFIPATAMTARTTNGAATGTTEMATNMNMFATLNFDATTAEYAQFCVRMPKSWDEGTVTFAPTWSHAAAATYGVVFELAGIAISNDDAGDVAFGTAQSSTDTGGTTNDIYIGPTSSAITIAGTPQAEDYVMFQINRAPANGSDTLDVDARLHGITLYYTVNAATDA
jgi:hypothetical protein